MTDDIVTRLQASIDGDYFGSREDMKEAVAEIERLRKEVANLQASYDVATNWQYKFLAAYDEMTKVVRDASA